MPTNVGFFLKRVGLEVSLTGPEGPRERAPGYYRLKIRDVYARMVMSYALSLSDLSLLHSWTTQELWRRRKELSRSTDGIFDPYRQQPDAGTATDGNAPGNPVRDGRIHRSEGD